MIEYIILLLVALVAVMFFQIKFQNERLNDMEAELRCLLEKYERAKKLWKR
jgi:hypothetical protein